MMKTLAFVLAASAAVLFSGVYSSDVSTCPRLTVDAATRIDGSTLSAEQYIDPSLRSAGGTHFGVRNKADGDDLYDDGIMVQNGSSLQVGAKSMEAEPFGIEILISFNHPVTAHSIGIYDPKADSTCTINHSDTGMFRIYVRKEEVRSIPLPPSNAEGGVSLSLGDIEEVVKITIDTGDGCWKTAGLLEITPPCGPEHPGGRGPVVGGGALTSFPVEMREELQDIAKLEERKFEFPACVGLSVAACVKIVEKLCPECVGRIKPAPPRKFNFYRIWIFCDENGKVVGTPNRG